jgi:hypothetical protein
VPFFFQELLNVFPQLHMREQYNRLPFFERMPMPAENPAILQMRTELIDGMLSYMQADSSDPDFDAGYSAAEVNRCAAILDAFLLALGKANGPHTPEAIMQATERAVLALNDLNDQCDGSLIETDQREQLCAIIIQAAQHAGLDTDVDITEQWRDW